MEKLKLTLLLPGRMDRLYADWYGEIVENVLWDRDEKNLEALIRDNDFDIALEWQYGHQDHTVLDLVKKYNKKARVILCLNWNGTVPDDFDKTGYFAHMNVPLPLKETEALLIEAKKSLGM